MIKKYTQKYPFERHLPVQNSVHLQLRLNITEKKLSLGGGEGNETVPPPIEHVRNCSYCDIILLRTNVQCTQSQRYDTYFNVASGSSRHSVSRKVKCVTHFAFQKPFSHIDTGRENVFSQGRHRYYTS